MSKTDQPSSGVVPDIHKVAALFRAENGADILHSFDDFLETCGAPMDKDCNDELNLDGVAAWFCPTGERMPYEIGEVYAAFKDRLGNVSYHSLLDIHEGGLPACVVSDELLDLDSEQVFVKDSDGHMVVLTNPNHRIPCPNTK